jgi:ribosomal protein S18 acetylase RimI-like enzyme
MNIRALRYEVKTASREDIRLHLLSCNDRFSPSLTGRVRIDEYACKLFEKSMTFEAWSDETLIGLVATYFNDPRGSSAYVSNVSVDIDFAGQGVATKLMKSCLRYAAQCEFTTITLEVSPNNNSAIGLYERLGFTMIGSRGGSVIMRFFLTRS